MAKMPATAGFSPEFYRDLFHALENPALVIDTDFTIRDANDAAVELLGYENRTHLLGTRVRSILVDTEVLLEVAERVAVQDRWEGEVKIRTNGNRVLIGTGTAVPVEHPDEGQMIAGLFSDLTERRQYTRSVKVLNRVLRHNLRNDANVIVGEIEQLRLGVDDAYHDSLDEIYNIIQNFIKRADRARELETLIREKDAHELRSVRLNEYLERAIANAERRYNRVELSRPPQFEPVTVVADETVSKVFREVIENAVEHNDSDPPEIRVSQTVSETAAQVNIADNGPGLNPENADRMFGREESDQLHHGSGMGLFFVDQVMSVYGGEVWIEENVPRGTTVKLRFPRTE